MARNSTLSASLKSNSISAIQHMIKCMIMEGALKARETEPKRGSGSTRDATKAKDTRSKPIAGSAPEKMRRETGASADLVGEAGVRPASRSASEPLQDARITFVISNAAKKRIYAKAKREGGSVADYIRSAIEGYDPSAAAEEAQLRALLDVFKVTHQETLDALDATESKLDALIAKLEATAQ